MQIDVNLEHNDGLIVLLNMHWLAHIIASLCPFQSIFDVSGYVNVATVLHFEQALHTLQPRSASSMSVLNEQWLQDIAEAQGLPALNPTIVKMMLPVIEVHIKKIVQQANKFQRRGKASAVSGMRTLLDC